MSQQPQPHQLQGRPFSPPQQVTSPGAPQGFPLPPNKRQRLSPEIRSHPTSPYVQSPYGVSPGATTPSSATASPHFNNISLPPNVYNTPYTNGHTTPTINVPNTSPNTPQSQQPLSYAVNNPPPNGIQNSQQPGTQFNPNYNHTPQTPGTMGPPSKPVEKEHTNDDQTDVLANAGVDLRAEENFAMSFYTGSFGSQPSFSQPGTAATSHAFTQFAPQDSSSFYGAGPANQPGQATDRASQEELEKKAADQAWADAALNLARSRQHELNHPHVHVAHVWTRMEKIARENGLGLHTDSTGKMPQLKLPNEFRSDVRVQTMTGPDGAMTVTNGTFLPADTALADQLALISLATNQRLRILLEEAVALARGRQSGSSGVVPSKWSGVAISTTPASGTIVADDAPRTGWESAVSPRTNPLNRSLSGLNRLPTPVSDGIKTPTGAVNFTNELAKALRKSAEAEREFEEARIAKRNARAAGGTPRSGSIVPGTPGAIAPEPSAKPLTKKEREKQDKGRQSIADSHAQANATTATFLFGSKKKKQYSWMTGGTGGGSGTSTPGALKTQGLPGTPGTASTGGVEKQRLTAENRTKIGSHREDKEGPLIQLRDWVHVLENDGREKKSLQRIYGWLEQSRPKPERPGRS